MNTERIEIPLDGNSRTVRWCIRTAAIVFVLVACRFRVWPLAVIGILAVIASFIRTRTILDCGSSLVRRETDIASLVIWRQPVQLNGAIAIRYSFFPTGTPVADGGLALTPSAQVELVRANQSPLLLQSAALKNESDNSMKLLAQTIAEALKLPFEIEASPAQ